MALSGRILGSFGGASTSQVRPVLTWTATQSVSGNYSNVTASLVFENYRKDLWTSYNRNGHSVTLTINGNKSTSSRAFDIRNKDSQTVWTRTVRVNHNSDGKKSFSLSVSGNTGVRLGSYNISGTGALTQIPRASTLSAFSFASHLQPSTAVNLNYTIDRKSGSFRHEIQLRDGSHVVRTWDNVSSDGSSSVQLSTANVNSLLNRMSSVTSKSLTLRVRTRSGNNGGWIGSAVTRNATATVNANVKPTVGALSLSQTGNSVSSHYLQSKSKVKASFTRSAGYGASISSSSIQVRRKSGGADSQTINSNDGTTSRAVSLTGTYQARGTAKDSRGRTTHTSWAEFSVTAYSPPRITNFTAVRGSSTETTIIVTRNATHTSLGRANSARMLIQKRTGTGAWTTVQDTSDAGGSWAGSVNSTGNSVTNSYDFRATLTDAFGETATATVTVSTQRVVLDIHKNEGVGIGKIHEQGVLDINGDLYTDGTIRVVPYVDGSNKSNPIQIYSKDANGHGYFEFYGSDNKRKGILGIPTNTSENIELRNEIGGNTRVQAGRDTVILTAPEVHLNGQVSYSGVVSGQTLWTGVWHMSASQTVTPSRRLSQCPNGWALIFGYYSSAGASHDYNFNTTFIHKAYASHYSGAGMFALNVYNGTDKLPANKYLYVSSNQITGHVSNAQSPSSRMVLRRVIAW